MLFCFARRADACSVARCHDESRHGTQEKSACATPANAISTTGQAHARIGFSVSAKDTGKSGEHSRADKANVQRANFSAANDARLLDITLHVAQSAASALQERLARRSQAHRARSPGEKRMTQHLLELENLLRQGRLAQVQPRVRSEVLRPPPQSSEGAAVRCLHSYVKHHNSVRQDIGHIVLNQAKWLIGRSARCT